MMAEAQPHPSTAPEQPTEERPAAEPDTQLEYKGGVYTRIDPDNELFGQLRHSAAERGRPDMVGLEWVEEDGMRYRVSSHEKLTRTRQEVVGTSRLPRIVKHSIAGPTLEWEEIYEEVPETVDYRTVDVFNKEGDLVDILTFTGSRHDWTPRRIHKASPGEIYVKPDKPQEIDNFEGHFSESTLINPHSVPIDVRVPRPVVGFRWVEQPARPDPEGPGRLRASAVRNREKGDLKDKSLEDKTQELFEALAKQQSEHGIENWVGLTWNSPVVKRDRYGNWSTYDISQMQIIRDEITIKGDGENYLNYIERVFEVRTRSSDGKTSNRHVYTLAELQELFNHKEASDRKQSEQQRRHHKDLGPAVPPAVPLNLHWETSRKPEETEEAGHQPEPHITFEDALALLVGGGLGHTDLHATVERIKHTKPPHKEMKGHERVEAHEAERARTYAHELLRTFEEIGRDRLYAIVEQMRGAYMSLDIDLHRLGIPSSSGYPPAPRSDSQILQTLMQRRLAGDTTLLSENSEERRRHFAKEIETELGWLFMRSALKIAKKNIPDEDPKDPAERAEKTIYLRADNPELLFRIQYLLYHKAIENMLEEEKGNTEEDSKFGRAEFARLGGMLRRSFGRA